MLKDMGDSRRVNANLLPKVKKRCLEEEEEEEKRWIKTTRILSWTPSVRTLISRHFWPPLQTSSENLRLHPKVRKKLDAFAKEYSILRNPRILEWRHGLVSSVRALAC